MKSWPIFQCMTIVVMAFIFLYTQVKSVSAQQIIPLDSPETSGSTIITEPFMNFFKSLNIDLGQRNPFFTRIQNQIGGTSGELQDIFKDIKKVLELLEGLTQIIFNIFMSFLHFLGDILDTTGS